MPNAQDRSGFVHWHNLYSKMKYEWAATSLSPPRTTLNPNSRAARSAWPSYAITERSKRTSRNSKCVKQPKRHLLGKYWCNTMHLCLSTDMALFIIIVRKRGKRGKRTKPVSSYRLQMMTSIMRMMKKKSKRRPRSARCSRIQPWIQVSFLIVNEKNENVWNEKSFDSNGSSDKRR